MKIADRKTILKAETSAQYRGKPLIVILEAHNVVIYSKRGRELYRVPWLAVHELGMKLEARHDWKGRRG